ncbi:MAG: UvrD-helicase domain-containing protein [Bacilli bacterium]|nr:UvrD-helicase domain-containing protein [Bacilli bacterium]
MIPTKPKNATWTDEQWQAIYEDGKNIIVSAGAGSGKTAVLTERVIRKLKDGIHINQLLILTFTKAAASEMADRIRKKIKKDLSIKEELNLLDSAYITTFDSYALSIVKKYHYLLNISDNINIIDSNVILLKKKQIIDEIFLKKYEQKEIPFLNFINKFCTKDDNEIKDYILNIINKLDLLSNKKIYLRNYIIDYLNEQKISSNIKQYESLIKEKIDSLKLLIEDISYINNDFASKLHESLTYLFNANNYNDIKNTINLRLPNAPKGSPDELKSIKTELSETIKEIKALAFWDNELEIKETINSTSKDIKTLIDIILEYWDIIESYKKEINCYEFNDIAIMAINIIKNNNEVRKELLNSFNEIMVDEYQDTNDLQEEFISMISNHNVYMVGDIKQSIYRFRNANPYIFKEKYDKYSTSNIDLKIDLNKNFRSRKEVLDPINQIFNLIMSDNIGGANYIKDHQMLFGNNTYLDNKPTHSNEIEIYSYNYDKDNGYTKEETEAFIIANDILKKYNNKIKIFDKDTSTLRDINYDDFSIIIDRTSSFDLYKKIFSYYGIPVTILKDEKMNDSDDINVIKNIIKIIILIKNKNINTEFKYLFTSILRSFIYNYSDEEILKYYINNSFTRNKLYSKCLEISKRIDSISITELLNIIEEEFNYYDNLIKLGNINNNIIKWDKLKELANNLSDIGYDIENFSYYLDDLTKNELNISYTNNSTNNNSVKIMTIHKSKGLEYPICYFSGLYKKFNISDLKEKILYDKYYGIIMPYFKEGIGETIYKELLKRQYIKEEISEKIRLFYVALTRAREKIIIINPIVETKQNYNNSTTLSDNLKLSYRSLSDIINSIIENISNYIKVIDLNTINLTHSYNNIKSSNYTKQINANNTKIKVNEINNKNEIIEKEHYSKKSISNITKEEYNNMQLGTSIHELFEYMDLKNPNYNSINNEFYISTIKSFLSNKLMKNIKKSKIYKEYEFIYSNNDIEYHGIIDLILEYEDHIDIIDYKLKNINDKEYINQLNGYKDYIKTKTDKKINLYLYSILDKEFYEIK